MIEDGFYRIKDKHETHWSSIGEIRTIEDIQYLYLIGFDEPVEVNSFDIHKTKIFMDNK